MKKMFVLLLAAIMLMSAVSVTAFADGADLTAEENGYFIGVKEHSQGVNPWEAVDIKDSYAHIALHVEWDDLTFTYDFGETWDPEQLMYVNVPGWVKEDKTVTVENRSNCAVNAAIEFNKTTDWAFEDVEVTFDVDNVNLESAYDGEAKSYTFHLTPSGEPADYIKDSPIGSITVTVGAPIIPVVEPTTTSTGTDETEGGEHECHFVYDQFGRLVCTGCNKIKHEYCIDEDEDGLCDECGMERDFCPDCHVGGKCLCT